MATTPSTGELISKPKSMFFKKKKQEEVPLDQKIEKAILKKKRQMVAMYLVGVLGGSSWCYTYFGAKEVFDQLVSPKTIVYENTRVIQVAKAAEVPEEKPWKTAEFSAYTASADETDASPLVMASGKMVYVGAIACPRSMKLGTQIEVRGLGVYTCEDRMAERYESHFDIFMVTKGEALKFGRKTLEWREA